MTSHTDLSRSKLRRREMMAASAGSLLAAQLAPLSTLAADDRPAHQATGVKVGEVTDSSAIVWTRLTEHPTRNKMGVVIQGRATAKEPGTVTVPVADLEGACPGAEGQVRIRYLTREGLSDAVITPWESVSRETDFAHRFVLRGLKPDTVYHYIVETTGPGGSPQHGAVQGRFETAPTPTTPSNFRFCVMTCQAYHDRDHVDGHHIYASMLGLAPKFVAFTGDNVYYDSEQPKAVSAELARYHWQRMFSLPRQIELLRNVGSYWEKDDHDCLSDDSWPGAKMGDLTFAEGQTIFRQQVPLGEAIYRTFRWGRDLQIWLTEGRDFRSPNSMPDGPEKSVWGREQKEWLKRTLLESDATWKLLISPTPIVGPDRPNKNDNLANRGFKYEGNEIRAWLHEHLPENFFALCGDRHWQYHSVHPETGVVEFAVGPASDQHAGGSPGEDKAYHRFHRVKGGFLSVTLRREGTNSTITFQHRDVHGEVVYEWSKQRTMVVS